MNTMHCNHKMICVRFLSFESAVAGHFLFCRLNSVHMLNFLVLIATASNRSAGQLDKRTVHSATVYVHVIFRIG